MVQTMSKSLFGVQLMIGLQISTLAMRLLYCLRAHPSDERLNVSCLVSGMGVEDAMVLFWRGGELSPVSWTKCVPQQTPLNCSIIWNKLSQYPWRYSVKIAYHVFFQSFSGWHCQCQNLLLIHQMPLRRQCEPHSWTVMILLVNVLLQCHWGGNSSIYTVTMKNCQIE